jgi:hypothetical protein
MMEKAIDILNMPILDLVRTLVDRVTLRKDSHICTENGKVNTIESYPNNRATKYSVYHSPDA